MINCRSFRPTFSYSYGARLVGSIRPPAQIRLERRVQGFGVTGRGDRSSPAARSSSAAPRVDELRQSDAAGEASNAYKVATSFGTGYTFEFSYLDLALKAGVIGLLLYLSFPLRLIFDAWAPAKAAIRSPAVGASGVVVGVIAGILIAGATNPYLFPAFGLVSILVMVAWLEKGPESAGGRPRSPNRLGRRRRCLASRSRRRGRTSRRIGSHVSAGRRARTARRHPPPRRRRRLRECARCWSSSRGART
jgi:hypothetical protein